MHAEVRAEMHTEVHPEVRAQMRAEMRAEVHAEVHAEMTSGGGGRCTAQAPCGMAQCQWPSAGGQVEGGHWTCGTWHMARGMGPWADKQHMCSAAAGSGAVSWRLDGMREAVYVSALDMCCERKEPRILDP